MIGGKTVNNREQSEKEAWKDGNVYTVNSNVHSRFYHVFQCPNTKESMQNYYYKILKEKCNGKRVLEIGCGCGSQSLNAYNYGASYVKGIDISEIAINEAKKTQILNKVEFEVSDIMQDKIDGKYDVIFGLAILHHIEWRSVLDKLYNKNLNKNGCMLFMEPLGSNIFIKLYHKLNKSATTDNEKQFTREDIIYLSKRYNFKYKSINYISFIIGVVSSLISKNPGNLAMRIANSIDNFIERHVRILKSRYRAAIFTIIK